TELRVTEHEVLHTEQERRHRRMIHEAPRQMAAAGEVVELVAVEAPDAGCGQVEGDFCERHGGDQPSGQRRERRARNRLGARRGVDDHRTSFTRAARTMSTTVFSAVASSIDAESTSPYRWLANQETDSRMKRAVTAVSGTARN